MNIVFNEKETIIANIPVVCQLEKDGLFIPCALALTEKELIIFSDLHPDKKDSASVVYEAKVRIPKETIQIILNEKLVEYPAIKKFNRLNILNRVVEDSRYIYYYKAHSGAVKKFLRRTKLKTQKLKTNCEPIA